ncbi:MAG: type I methionyl aminopeptidase [Firmicutes bacterium]|nr:type I methionyl aminopeptidase [Bacillota bacterium]
MISIKNDKDIEKMAKAGSIVSEALKLMESMIKVGISTMQLNDEAEKFILSKGAIPSFKNYNGYKFASCMSVDDVVVHGFPSNRLLEEGEILSIDIGAKILGFHADAARTFAVGKISRQKQRLIDVTKQSFFEGLKECKEGARLGDMAFAIQHYVESHGFSVVRSMCGHGIGKKLHEDPQVLNYGQKNTGIKLKNGYALAIEPMVNLGEHEVYTDIDGWACRTKDGLPSAHYENTVIVTKDAPIILTI